jgi:hypothetical protein
MKAIKKSTIRPICILMDRDLRNPLTASVYGRSVIWTLDGTRETRLNQFRPLRQVTLFSPSQANPSASSHPIQFDEINETVFTDDDKEAFQCESLDSLGFEFGDCWTSP